MNDLRIKTDQTISEISKYLVGIVNRDHSEGVILGLSGGLDSGSVMAVASRLLGERDESLMAFTSVPLSDPSAFTGKGRFGDETQLAQASARYAGNVEHHLVRAESVSPLAGIERMLWVNDEPGHAAVNLYWITALYEAARQRGVGVLLTGQHGNATISWTGAGENLLPVLLDGDIAGFRRAFETARRGAGLGHWRGQRFGRGRSGPDRARGHHLRDRNGCGGPRAHHAKRRAIRRVG